jgi:hypothetical protein
VRQDSGGPSEDGCRRTRQADRGRVMCHGDDGDWVDDFADAGGTAVEWCVYALAFLLSAAGGWWVMTR